MVCHAVRIGLQRALRWCGDMIVAWMGDIRRLVVVMAVMVVIVGCKATFTRGRVHHSFGLARRMAQGTGKQRCLG